MHKKYLTGDEVVGMYHYLLSTKSVPETAKRYGISDAAVRDWTRDIETAMQTGKITRRKGRQALEYAIKVFKSERASNGQTPKVVAAEAAKLTSKQLYARAAELYKELGDVLLQAARAEADERIKDLISKVNPFAGASL